MLGLGRDLFDFVQHLVVFREAPDPVLAPDRRPVHVHVEHAARTLDQRRINPELPVDRIR